MIIILLLQMLEKGPCDYHRPVMRLIHAYLKLQDCQAPEIVTISREILAVVCQHIKVSSELYFFLPPSYIHYVTFVKSLFVYVHCLLQLCTYVLHATCLTTTFFVYPA